MKYIFTIFLAFFIANTVCAHTGGIDFYVSPSGNDNNSGSIAKPFYSIEKAKDAVRSALTKNPALNVTVYLRGGNYFVENTIRFDERDGNKNITVKYIGYKNEKAIINGGVAIKGWQKVKGNIYRAKLPVQLQGKHFYRLFDNSQSPVLARNPNAGSGFGGGIIRINNTTIQVPDSWVNYDFTNAQVCGWIGDNWFTEVRAVRSFDKKKHLLTIDGGSGNFGGLNNRIYIQGVPELLDEENEWCIKNDSVYYYPAYKTDINKHLIVAPTEARVIELKGSTPSNLIENITFENITFIGSDFAKSWRIFSPNDDGTMPDETQEGLIYIENAKNISVKYCQIKGAGHSAIYINNKSESCTIYGCAISDVGFCGVYVNSYPPGDKRFAIAAESYINKKHTISNNFIHDCGLSIGGGCGIQLFQSGENRITHNVICNMPRYGISYKGMRNGVLVDLLRDKKVNYVNHFDYVHTRNNYIAYNEIYNVCRSSFDFGAIESWGPGRDNVWECNAIHDIDQAVYWDGWAHGLYPDDGSDFITIKNNIVYELKGGSHTAAVMAKSMNEQVYNNIFADNDIGVVATTSAYAEPVKGIVIRNNIFYKSGKELYLTDKEKTFGKGFYGGKEFYPDEIDVKFNKGYVKDSSIFKEVNHNLIYPNYSQLDSIKKYGWDTHSIIADPLFDKKHPQWDITYFDYQLKPTSPSNQIKFVPINFDSIGLLKDFPFGKKLIKSAASLIQAEDYNRTEGLRSIGSTGIYKMQQGAWAKYDNIDFGSGLYSKFVCTLKEFDNSNSAQCLFEIRLDAPNGKLVGKVNQNDKQTSITKIKGVHNLFLVFQKQIMLDCFRFSN